MTSVAQIEARFTQIAEVMAELPFYHTELTVELVGWQSVARCELGVLITPWSLSLLCFPEPVVHLPRKGSRWELVLPSGFYDCVVHWDEQLGSYAYASLESTMQRFADQATARAVAMEIVQLLLQPPAGAPARVLSRRTLLQCLSGQEPEVSS